MKPKKGMNPTFLRAFATKKGLLIHSFLNLGRYSLSIHKHSMKTSNMRIIFTFAILTLSLSASTTLKAQSDQSDSTGLPGDNFSLQGALEMFKKAGSPEELEKLINSQDNGVNNLDLNGDGQIDYIKVIAKKQGDAHVFVLQDIISEKESQDIAVIELEKTGDANAVVQIVGDEDIYGDSTTVEPRSDGNAFVDGQDETYAFAAPAHGPNIATPHAAIIVNVWLWPCVRFVYAPAYVPWVSPWAWRRYPVYWHPWRPIAWAAYRPIRYRYYPRYAVVHTNRVVVARNIYRPVRVTSVTVYNRNRVVVNNYRTTHVTRRPMANSYGNRPVNRPYNRTAVAGSSRGTVTRRTTTVTGPRGGTATRRTTTVTGPRGGTATRRTTTVTGPRGNTATRTRGTVRGPEHRRH